MSYASHVRRLDRDRLVSGIAVGAIHAALAYALLTGLGVSLPQQAQQALEAFDVTDPPPPPSVPPPDPPRPQAERAPEEEGAAAPPNIKSRATEATAPKTEIPIPPPITVAELPGTGSDSTSGNAPIAGPGTGAGGFGDGTGSGRFGSGPGGGGGGGRPALPIRRELGTVDCGDPGSTCRSVEITMRFTVGTDGRVSGCRVQVPSGDALVDREACPRAERRLRFQPALDVRGQRIAATITWVHEFVREERLDYDDPAEDDRGRRR